MPRDTKRFDYRTLAIPRDSQLYQSLLADAAASGKSLSDLALLRLADYYRGNQSGISETSGQRLSAPGDSRALQLALKPQLSRVPSAASEDQTQKLENLPVGDEEVLELEFSRTRASINAMIALDAIDGW